MTVMKSILSLFIVSGICFAADPATVAQARSAMLRGELTNAEQILLAAIDQTESRMGPNATAADPYLDILIQVYQREKRFPDALAAAQKRVDIWSAALGENAVNVGRNLGRLAALEKTISPAVAENHARRALAIMTAEYSNGAPSAQAAEDLADILISENKNDEAEQMLAAAQKAFEASPSPMLAAGVAAHRAALLRHTGHVAEADQLAQSAQPSPAGPYRIGRQIAPPHIIKKVEPQYSEAARKSKLQGSITLSLVVDATGTPTQIVILRPLGLGLDEKALSAISTWRFRPAMKNGEPVAAFATVEMTFKLL